MKWRKGILIAAFAAVVVLLLAILTFIITSARTDVGKKVRLPDGSTLALREVVCTATNYTYRHPRGGKLVQKLAPILPPWIQKRFGTFGGSLTLGSPAGTTNLIVVTHHHSPGKTQPPPLERLRLVDDTGCAHDVSWGASMLANAGDAIQAWQTQSLPRRSRTLLLQFLAKQSDGSHTNVAEFHIPNPLYADYPQWTPEPWPATQHVGDLAVALQEFQAGARSSHEPGKRDVPNAANAARKTRLVFSFAENGVRSEDWRVQKLTISDATGNHWSPYLDFVSQDFNWTTNGTVEFFGALWPSEQAWKLNLEVVRAAGFTPEQTWEIPLALPPPRIVNTLTNQWEHDGAAVKLISLASPETDHAGDYKWVAKWWGSEKSKVYSLALSIDPRSKTQRLSVIRCLDQDGREIKIVQHGGQDYSKQAVFFKPAPDATSARLTLALQRSRSVEFLARPQFVE